MSGDAQVEFGADGAAEVRPTRRVYELDLMRLVAAMFVLLYHTWRHSADPAYHQVGYPAWLSSWTRYGFLGVELFFFISGMVIFNSVGSGSARRFAESRFIRLFPAYWAAVVFTWLVIRLWAGGIAHLEMASPARWREQFGGDPDLQRAARGYAAYEARLRQFAAVLAAHGIEAVFDYIDGLIAPCPANTCRSGASRDERRRGDAGPGLPLQQPNGGSTPPTPAMHAQGAPITPQAVRAPALPAGCEA